MPKWLRESRTTAAAASRTTLFGNFAAQSESKFSPNLLPSPNTHPPPTPSNPSPLQPERPAASVLQICCHYEAPGWSESHFMISSSPRRQARRPKGGGGGGGQTGGGGGLTHCHSRVWGSGSLQNLMPPRPPQQPHRRPQR